MEQYQHRNPLSILLQAPRHLERDQATVGVSDQYRRTFEVRFLELIQIEARHIFNLVERLPATVDALCLDSVNWMSSSNFFRKRPALHRAAKAMHNEDRWLFTAKLDLYKRREFGRCGH